MYDKLDSDFKEILNLFFTAPDRLPFLLARIDKKALESYFVEILNLYANDVNSSTLRELITILKAGYEPQRSGMKLGYNGVTSGENRCEVKPVNIRGSSGNKLNGGGNFSDFAYERLNRYLEAKLMMIVSGFIDGHLVDILEFPFSYRDFVAELRRQLERQFKIGKRKPGQFLRSAQFSFKHCKNGPRLKLISIG
jgi:hypothetical protein